MPRADEIAAHGQEGAPEPDEIQLLAHELRNTLFATDMLLERALEHEELGTDPMEDVRRAREGVQETLDGDQAPARASGRRDHPRHQLDGLVPGEALVTGQRAPGPEVECVADRRAGARRRVRGRGGPSASWSARCPTASRA